MREHDEIDAVPPGMAENARWARRWLCEAALPLWSSVGVDRQHGGFFDKIALDGRPVEEPKRLRVQARQIFVFAAAADFGWTGCWHEMIDHGLRHMRSLKRPDGFFAGTAGGSVDIYDQAFVLLALESAYRTTGRPDPLRLEAESLLANLVAKLAHPLAGFEEAVPRVLPLRSNPHMHLLEALLAWIALGVRGQFETIARAIVGLACTALIDDATGAIGEYYDGTWQPAPGIAGSIREPGHQFEWAYLLGLAADLLALDLSVFRERLVRFGDHGVKAGHVVFSVDPSGKVIDGSARLWAQTEYLRTMLTLAGSASSIDRPAASGKALEAFSTVRHYLENAPYDGLWRERRTADCAWIEEPAPASSLYHIVTGFQPLLAGRAAVNQSKPLRTAPTAP